MQTHWFYTVWPFIGLGGAVVMVAVLLMTDTFRGDTTVSGYGLFKSGVIGSAGLLVYCEADHCGTDHLGGHREPVLQAGVAAGASPVAGHPAYRNRQAVSVEGRKKALQRAASAGATSRTADRPAQRTGGPAAGLGAVCVVW